MYETSCSASHWGDLRQPLGGLRQPLGGLRQPLGPRMWGHATLLPVAFELNVGLGRMCEL